MTEKSETETGASDYPTSDSHTTSVTTTRAGAHWSEELHHWPANIQSGCTSRDQLLSQLFVSTKCTAQKQTVSCCQDGEAWSGSTRGSLQIQDTCLQSILCVVCVFKWATEIDSFVLGGRISTLWCSWCKFILIKRKKRLLKMRASCLFFFQSQTADLPGFSPGARNRRRATGTWPLQTWAPRGEVAWPSVPSSTDSSLRSCAYQSQPAALPVISVQVF